jgi:hypothetical protein
MLKFVTGIQCDAKRNIFNQAGDMLRLREIENTMRPELEQAFLTMTVFPVRHIRRGYAM